MAVVEGLAAGVPVGSSGLLEVAGDHLRLHGDRSFDELGQRVRAVTAELNNEKIDIVDYAEELATFVSNALSPAKVTSAYVIDASTKAVRALVPDYQLSLAIGKEGQNARLAAKLTGARIDIQPDSILESP